MSLVISRGYGRDEGVPDPKVFLLHLPLNGGVIVVRKLKTQIKTVFLRGRLIRVEAGD
jgi:hypothetical protein